MPDAIRWPLAKSSTAQVEHGLRGVVSRDPAHAPAAACPRPAQPHVRIRRLDPPAANRLGGLRVRPAEVTVKDVAAGHTQLCFELERRPCLETWPALGGAVQAVL